MIFDSTEDMEQPLGIGCRCWVFGTVYWAGLPVNLNVVRLNNPANVFMFNGVLEAINT